MAYSLQQNTTGERNKAIVMTLFENKSIIEKIDNYFKDIKKQNREFLKVDVAEGEVVLDMESKHIDNLK